MRHGITPEPSRPRIVGVTLLRYTLTASAGLLLLLALMVLDRTPDAPKAVVVTPAVEVPLTVEQLSAWTRTAEAAGAETVLIVLPLEPAGSLKINVAAGNGDTLQTLAKKLDVDEAHLRDRNKKAFDPKGALTKGGTVVAVEIEHLRDPARALTGIEGYAASRPQIATVFQAAGRPPVLQALARTVVVIDGAGQVVARPAGGSTDGTLTSMIAVALGLLCVGLVVPQRRAPVQAPNRPGPPLGDPRRADRPRLGQPPSQYRVRDDPPWPAPQPAADNASPKDDLRPAEPASVAQTPFDFSRWIVTGRRAQSAGQCPACGVFADAADGRRLRCHRCGHGWEAGTEQTVVLGEAGSYTGQAQSDHVTGG